MANDSSAMIGTLRISAGSIPFDSGQISIEILAENAEWTDEGVVLHPAPGYRCFWVYWNGEWWDEYNYLRTPGLGCRAVLRYFDDGRHNALWLENVNLPDWRFEKIQDLAACDSLLVTAHEYKSKTGKEVDWYDFENMVPTSYQLHSPNANGDFPVGQRVDLPYAMERVRRAILQSRKK